MAKTIPTIHRSGVIFRPGNFGAKGTYTDADIDAMAGACPPIRMGHHPTLIEKAGALGMCKRTYAGYDAKGKALFAEWDEPQPLAELLGDIPRTLSVEIDLATKRLVALALEVTPHIGDAAFFSARLDDAYAKFSKGEPITPLGGDPCRLFPPGETAAEMNKRLADGIIGRRLDASQPVSEARRRELLGMTGPGVAALNKETADNLIARRKAEATASFGNGSVSSVVDGILAKDREDVLAMFNKGK